VSKASTPVSMLALLHQVDREELRPDGDAVREAHKRANKLIEEIQLGPSWMFDIVEVIEHGSMSRGTGLRSFRDLDKLVILNPEALRTQAGSERTPKDTIHRLADTVRKRRAGLVSLGTLEVRAQAHSVGVSYPASSIRIDLVPAVRTRTGQIVIPEPGTESWIQTNPGETRRRLEDAKRLAPHAGVAIRLLKGWSRARGGVLPSFGIETAIVNQILAFGPTSLVDLVRGFIEGVAASDMRRPLLLGASRIPFTPVTLVDPVSGANLTNRMGFDHKKKLIDRCRWTRDHLSRLDDIGESGKREVALTLARKLFVGDH